MRVENIEPAQISAIAGRLGAHEFKGWFYGDSIGFEGFLAAANILNETKWMDFSNGFFRAWATRMEPFQLDDNTAPGHIMCEIIERTNDEVLKSAVLKLAQHLRRRRKVNNVSITFNDTLRSLMQPYGNVKLSADEQLQMEDPGPGVYLDCMHFDAPFYAHLSRIDPDGGWAQLAVTEILGYKYLLLDTDTDLYKHFWLEKVDRAYCKGWGRGQGWALLGLLDVLYYVDEADGLDLVREEAEALANVMLGYQLKNGNWHSLVHEPRSGSESSTAAFMATAFYRGMTQGVLPEHEFLEPAERAFRVMKANLDEKGNLMGVSAAVHSALVEKHYWYVPTNYIVPWGQGPVLTAIAARKAFEF